MITQQDSQALTDQKVTSPTATATDVPKTATKPQNEAHSSSLSAPLQNQQVENVTRQAEEHVVAPEPTEPIVITVRIGGVKTKESFNLTDTWGDVKKRISYWDIEVEEDPEAAAIGKLPADQQSISVFGVGIVTDTEQLQVAYDLARKFTYGSGDVIAATISAKAPTKAPKAPKAPQVSPDPSAQVINPPATPSAASKLINVFVGTLTEKKICLQAQLTDTWGDIKARLLEEWFVPVIQQKICPKPRTRKSMEEHWALPYNDKESLQVASDAAKGDIQVVLLIVAPKQISKAALDKILKSYKSSSVLGFLSTLWFFSWFITPVRSTAMLGLIALRDNYAEISYEQIKEALKKDSKRRESFFKSGDSNEKNSTGTDEVIDQLNKAFKSL